MLVNLGLNIKTRIECVCAFIELSKFNQVLNYPSQFTIIYNFSYLYRLIVDKKMNKAPDSYVYTLRL